MIKNMGNVDRIIRILLAILFVILYFTKRVTGSPGIVLLLFAMVFLLTSSVSYCPIYKLLGIKTTCNK